MAKKALIVWGGWDGHEPRQVSEIFETILKQQGFDVERHNSLDPLADEAKMKELSLFVPCWTMGKISKEQLKSAVEAVKGGVGIAGVHGGMCDAFREATEWQFMTGGQWVAHPGNDGVKYMVNIRVKDHPITRGIENFQVASEQYYMHVDPAVKVLATTPFPTAGVEGPHTGNGPVDMPVIWTKVYGQGKVFYNSLGHHADIIAMPQVTEIMRRGFLWAAR